jgi:hypothetical protein
LLIPPKWIGGPGACTDFDRLIRVFALPRGTPSSASGESRTDRDLTHGLSFARSVFKSRWR